MAKVIDVFSAAMSFMDELSQSGQAQTADTKEYEYRTPAILNMLVAEHNMLMSIEDWTQVAAQQDEVPVSQNYAIGVLPYGLAANLLVDENASAASFFQQRYEEMRDRYMRSNAADVSSIDNIYAGIEYGEFARW